MSTRLILCRQGIHIILSYNILVCLPSVKHFLHCIIFRNFCCNNDFDSLTVLQPTDEFESLFCST